MTVGMGDVTFAIGYLRGSAADDNNNTFTWSGPSGVLDCTGQRRVAPAAAWCMSSTHSLETVVSLNRQGEKTSAEEKDYDLGFGRDALCITRIR
jgi:hypothetical protein